MIDPQNVPDIREDEVLARFVLSKSHKRANQTLKANAFLPPQSGELSVTRHTDATEDEIWSVGKNVALARMPPKTLYGRGDIIVSVILEKKLRVISSPVLPENPNHANVVGWPSPEDKPAQKLIAQEIAAAAAFVPAP